MDKEAQIKALDRNIKEAKQFLDMGVALERLQANKDFRAVIKSGYFEQEAIRLVHLKAAPDMQTAEKQADIVRQMDAIGALNQYFQTVFYKAEMADKNIEADELTREELLAEALVVGE